MEKLILPVSNKGIIQNGGGNEPPKPVELVIGADKFNVNANGDAIDDKGVVTKTKAELEALVAVSKKAPEPNEEEKKKAEKLAEIDAQLTEGTKLEIDGKEYDVTKDGTIVVDGKVFKTKEELKALLLNNAVEPELDYVAEIQKATNLVIAGENDQPNTYDNTLPGITKYVEDVYVQGRKVGKSEYEQELFTKLPLAKQIIEHLTLGGTLENFVSQVDYSKVTIDDNEVNHIALYTAAQTKRGIPQEEIADSIKYLKEDKKLKTYAASALSFLQSDQIETETARTNAIASQKQADEFASKAYWAEVNKAVGSKKLVVGDKTFAIPEIIKVKDGEGKVVNKTINEFMEYIEKPVNFKINGQLVTMTQLDYDTYIEDTKRTPHHDLFDAYRKFTKYDDSQLIASNISDNIVKKVIKLNSKVSNGGSGNNASNTGKLILPINK